MDINNSNSNANINIESTKRDKQNEKGVNKMKLTKDRLVQIISEINNSEVPYNVSQVASYLCVSKTVINNLINLNLLNHKKIGHSVILGKNLSSLYSVKEASIKLNVTVYMVRRLIGNNALRLVSIGKTLAVILDPEESYTLIKVNEKAPYALIKVNENETPLLLKSEEKVIEPELKLEEIVVKLQEIDTKPVVTQSEKTTGHAQESAVMQSEKVAEPVVIQSEKVAEPVANEEVTEPVVNEEVAESVVMQDQKVTKANKSKAGKVRKTKRNKVTKVKKVSKVNKSKVTEVDTNMASEGDDSIDTMPKESADFIKEANEKLRKYTRGNGYDPNNYDPITGDMNDDYDAAHEFDVDDCYDTECNLDNEDYNID